LSRSLSIALILLASLALHTRAQANDVINPAARSIAMAATLPAYDIVSVRQSKLDSEDSSFDTTGDGVIIANAPLNEIIEYAYGLASFDLISGISGPVAEARFDIKAKITSRDGQKPAKLKDEQLEAMLIPLLADRFHLRARAVAKKMTVYELVVSAGGPKVTLSGPTVGPGAVNVSFSGDYNLLTLKHSSMSTLAGVLSDCGLHHLVTDRTGLTGNGDMTLKWSPDEAFEQGGRDLTTIFAAVQDQLGLKIQPAKLPVDTVVIDHAEMPTEN
jgi:uncharacterized protein (TIGR03435 family)